MSKKVEPAYQNKNHTGWWVYLEVEQWVSIRQKKLTLASRCLVWENTRIVRADSREEAYDKAIRFSKTARPTKTDHGEWRFAGISCLLPIYEELEDGAEILWHKRGTMTVAKIKQLVKPKRKLSVFDDTEVPIEP